VGSKLKLLDRQDSHSEAINPVVVVKESVVEPNASYRPVFVENDSNFPF